MQGMQIDMMNDKNPYWEQFEKLEQELKQPAWVFPIRKAGISTFSELGFPGVEDEDWRFTNVTPISRLPFQPSFRQSPVGITANELAGLPFLSLKASRLVFVDGQFVAALSQVQPEKEGIRIMNLSAALATESALIEKHLGLYSQGEPSAFTSLNTAFFQDGAFIYVPAGLTVEHPVHLLFLATGASPQLPRNLIIAEKFSRVTVLESFAATTTGAYFTNSVEELVIGEGAIVEHCKLQDESPEAYHVAAMYLHLGRACQVVAHSVALGSKLSRHNIRTNLAAEGIECVLNGLYLAKDDQLADHHMIVDHAKPHCNSHEYYNGILSGRSKGVFHGRILVRPDAQKTDAKQTNKNLLLSEDATIDTKPQLEIYADDVKCTHGATIGQLNDESIFYLRARGIGLDLARQMLIHAFAGEIIDRVRHTSAREELDQIVWDRLEQHPLAARN